MKLENPGSWWESQTTKKTGGIIQVTLSQELEPKLKTACDKAKAVSIVNVNGKVKILEAIAQGSIDVIKVADTESKLVEESAIKVAIAP